MPEPPGNMEQRLQAYARQRREAAGEDLSLHPATRRMLVDEAVRHYRRAPNPASREAAGWGLLWPRLTWAGAIMAASVLVLLPLIYREESPSARTEYAKRQTDSPTTLSASKAPALTGLAQAPPPSKKTPLISMALPEQVRAPMQPTANPKIATNVYLRLVEAPKVTEREAVQELRRAKSAPDLTVNGPVPVDRNSGNLSDKDANSPSSSGVGGVKLEDSATVAKPEPILAANTPELSPASSLESKAKKVSVAGEGGIERYGLARTASTAAPAASQAPVGRSFVAGKMTGVSTPALGVAFQNQAALSNARQNPQSTVALKGVTQKVLQNTTVLARAGTSLTVAGQTPTVMDSFEWRQNGEVLSIVDQDGSVYQGKILPDETRQVADNLSYGAANKQIAATPTAPLPSAGTYNQTANRSPARSPGVFFRAVGTHRSSRQNVVIEGTLENDATEERLVSSIPASTSNAGTISNQAATNRFSNAGQFVANAPSNQAARDQAGSDKRFGYFAGFQNNALRVRGQATLDGTNRIEIDAIPQAR